MELQSVTALVTGGARRVGKAISLGLADAGADLVLHYGRSREAAEETAAEAEALGAKVSLVGGDLSADPGNVMAEASAVGTISVLVNNAGVFPGDTIRDVTSDGWDHTMAINLKAPAFLTQAFANALPDGVPGAVVNVGDWRAARPYPDHFSYSVSKGALASLTVAAAEALAPQIRVNGVQLGAILPPPGKDSDYLRELAQEIPVEHVGGTDPVVASILFLLRNDFITGEIVRVDGGAHLR